ncbi:diguanylate cyclase [Candidatus Woesearchaeota archaeon]|nr:diguanylate cyclase [Candidatus Woesearchaeota archaeon]
MAEGAGDMRSLLETVVIKVSIGIGHNVEEAELALREAKTRKGQDFYNIVVYAGAPVAAEEVTSAPDVECYLRLEDRLQDDLSALMDLENLKYDPKTGLLNRVGYEVAVQKLKDRGQYGERVFMLIDGDDMKRANAALGYSTTDRYLEAIGNALRSEVRQSDETGDARDVDILVNRKNGAGGDEFVVDIGCSYRNAPRIARRYVRAMYSAQMELSRKIEQEQLVGLLCDVLGPEQMC